MLSRSNTVYFVYIHHPTSLKIFFLSIFIVIYQADCSMNLHIIVWGTDSANTFIILIAVVTAVIHTLQIPPHIIHLYLHIVL